MFLRLICIFVSVVILAGCASNVTEPSSDVTSTPLPSAVEELSSKVIEPSPSTDVEPSTEVIEPISSTIEPTPVLVASEEATVENLVGAWQDAMGVGSSYTNLYQFREDMTFDFIADAMDCANRERAFSGTWTFEDGKIILTKTQDLTLEGGTLEPSTASCGSDQELVGAKLVVNTYEDSEPIIFEVKPAMGEADSPYSMTQYFDGIQYWVLGGGPDQVDLDEVIAYYEEKQKE
ncbi:hypothetical protein I6N90_12510 [Paenibacillus sp. GSMTC-2017]|uniref:hypothetical protein n=1 Tax=Paenibacillus sp. GSMTC-2017 TaxID=2794350 RepID=UPI0018D7D7D2|nr:hypothetical protein [Paenibacillus sp. GSMTC-2017]MBH5318619.1 hypothetical protein [Paenibacillus sp. GSMTC-2017]